MGNRLVRVRHIASTTDPQVIKRAIRACTLRRRHLTIPSVHNSIPNVDTLLNLCSRFRYKEGRTHPGSAGPDRRPFSAAPSIPRCYSSLCHNPKRHNSMPGFNGYSTLTRCNTPSSWSFSDEILRSTPNGSSSLSGCIICSKAIPKCMPSFKSCSSVSLPSTRGW